VLVFAGFGLGTVQSERFQNEFTQWRKLILDGIPHNLVVNTVICVSQEVSHPPKTIPIRARRYYFGIATQTNGCLGQNLHLAFKPLTWFSGRLIGFEGYSVKKQLDVINGLKKCRANAWRYL
jgi:hypothetical protein